LSGDKKEFLFVALTGDRKYVHTSAVVYILLCICGVYRSGGLRGSASASRCVAETRRWRLGDWLSFVITNLASPLCRTSLVRRHRQLLHTSVDHAPT